MADYQMVIADGSITLEKLSPALQTEIGKIDTFVGMLKGLCDRTIEELDTPPGITLVGSNLCNGCASLKTAKINEGITRVSGASFNGCSALKTVYLPSTLTQIGNNAFNGCTALTDVYYNGTAADWAGVTVGTNNTALTGATFHYSS